MNDDAGLQGRSPVADVGGSISLALVAISRRTARDFGDVHADVLRALPEAAHVIAVVHRAVRGAVEEWLRAAGRAGRCTVLAIPDDEPLSAWTRDALIPCAGSGNGPLLLRPAPHERYRGGPVCDALHASGLTVDPIPLPITGGNVLVGEDVVLLGADDVARCGAALDGEEPASWLRRELDAGRRLIVVGSDCAAPPEIERPAAHPRGWTEVLHFGNRAPTTQPLFHLDLFVALAGRGADGRERVVVADARRGAEVLGDELREEALAGHFDAVAIALDEAGLAVSRAPQPLVYMDEIAARRRVSYFPPYANVLVSQEGAARPRVILPTFGHGAWPELAACDDANADLWQGLGFDVHRLGDCRPLAENLGGPRCLVQVLARTAPSGPP